MRLYLDKATLYGEEELGLIMTTAESERSYHGNLEPEHPGDKHHTSQSGRL